MAKAGIPPFVLRRYVCQQSALALGIIFKNYSRSSSSFLLKRRPHQRCVSMPQTDSCRFGDDYQIFRSSQLHMRNSEYSSNHLRPWACPGDRSAREGLPRFAVAIGIRKAGRVSSLHTEPQGEGRLEVSCSYGRAVAKIVCPRVTLKCNTQRAGLLSLVTGDGYNSIPITLLRTTLHFFFTQVCWHF